MNSASPYYPPRARWYSGVFKIGSRVRGLSHIDSIRIAGGLSLGSLLAALLVPGYSFALAGKKKLAQAILMASGLGILVYIALLGYSLGNLVFGLLVGLHGTGLVFLNRLLGPESSLPRRLGFGIGCIVALFVGYRVILDAVQNHWLIPLRANGQVVVVNRFASPNGVARGDLVAYRLPAQWLPGVYFRAGYGLDRVVGVPGDEIVFFPDHVEVNGQSCARHPLMPVNRSVRVPEKNWFIWPSYHIDLQGQAQAQTIRTGVFEAAMVPGKNFRGRPFESWFGRRQKLL